MPCWFQLTVEEAGVNFKAIPNPKRGTFVKPTQRSSLCADSSICRTAFGLQIGASSNGTLSTSRYSVFQFLAVNAKDLPNQTRKPANICCHRLMLIQDCNQRDTITVERQVSVLPPSNLLRLINLSIHLVDSYSYPTSPNLNYNFCKWNAMVCKL